MTDIAGQLVMDAIAFPANSNSAIPTSSNLTINVGLMVR